VRSLIRASMTAAAAVLVGLMVMFSPWGMAFEERFGLSWLFWTRGPLEPPADVVVVSLDGASGERLGLDGRLREWPRRLYVELIERLVAADAAVIVFDLRLDQPRDRADDAALAQAIRDAGRVALFEHLERRQRTLPGGGDALAGDLTTVRSLPRCPSSSGRLPAWGRCPCPRCRLPSATSGRSCRAASRRCPSSRSSSMPPRSTALGAPCCTRPAVARAIALDPISPGGPIRTPCAVT
jgi:hypothetical protein